MYKYTQKNFEQRQLHPILRKYHKNVIEHYKNPQNVGSLDPKDSNVGTGIVGAPACGDVMKLQVKIQDGIVEDVKFRTFGCGSAIASSSYATEWLKGKTVEDALSLKVSLYIYMDMDTQLLYIFTYIEYGYSKPPIPTPGKNSLFNVSRRCSESSYTRLSREK